MARRARHSGRDRTPEAEVDPYLGLKGYPDPAAGSEPEEDSASEAEPELGAEAHDLGERDLGPFDAAELDMEQTDAVGRLDFGSVRVPMPDEAKLQVESAPGGRLNAVHILVPLGRLTISSLAAPRSAPLWPGLADEIVAALKRDGASVHWELGPWGREVVAGTPTAQCRFIGVDRPRWMLYGVATAPADGVDELTDVLRDMIRGTIVVRDEQPYPVRTVLPLTAPPHLGAQLEKLQTEGPPESEPVAPPAEPVAELPLPPSRLEPPPPPPPPPPVAPAQPGWTQPGRQPDHAGPPGSGWGARHMPGQRGAAVPGPRRPERSNPGGPAPLPLQPNSPWSEPQRPRAADPHQFHQAAWPQPPRHGMRRPPLHRPPLHRPPLHRPPLHRPPDEHGVPTPPSPRALGDPLSDPLGHPLSAPRGDPLSDPLGVGELPELGEHPASTGLSDEPVYWTPSVDNRPSGRHRLPD